MSAAIEREFKLRIPSEDALARLCAELGGAAAAPVLQVNHFFDTPGRDLGRARLALRLREEAGAAALALKGPALERRGALTSRTELELALDPERARAILAGTRSPLDALRASAHAATQLVQQAASAVGAARLQRLGAFENERQRVGPVAFAGARALVFELDRTRFPGGAVELELEVELGPDADAPAVERGLAALFARLGLALETAPSKAARFLRHLDSARS